MDEQAQHDQLESDFNWCVANGVRTRTREPNEFELMCCAPQCEDGQELVTVVHFDDSDDAIFVVTCKPVTVH